MKALSTKEISDLALNYSVWIFNDCTEPISEVVWLLECALKSECKDEVIEALKTIPYEE